MFVKKLSLQRLRGVVHLAVGQHGSRLDVERTDTGVNRAAGAGDARGIGQVRAGAFLIDADVEFRLRRPAVLKRRAERAGAVNRVAGRRRPWPSRTDRAGRR